MADNDRDDTSYSSMGPVEEREGATILNPYRKAALSALDEAKLTPFHIKVCLVAGVGFFTDAYDLFAINIAAIMIGYVYGHVPDHYCRPALNSAQNLGLRIATPVGNLFGQLFFGWLADKVGRKRMYGVELIFMIVGTFAQATAGGGQAMNVIAMLVFWRFIVGVGIGGDYPLSATIASEFAPTHLRGRMMTAVFASQGGGNFLASLIGTILTSAFKDGIKKDFPNDSCLSSCIPGAQLQPLCSASTDSPNHLDYTWRILLAMGCVPAAIGMYFRLTIPETPRFTMDIERNVVQATEDVRGALKPQDVGKAVIVGQQVEAPRATREDFFRHFGQWKNLRVLVGTSVSWFCIDVAFYTLGLNASLILDAIGFGASGNVYETLRLLCIGNLILSVAGLIPGYWICFLFIDRWGRRPIQFMGFAVLTVLFSIMGFALKSLVKLDNPSQTAGTKFFVFLFCLANLFQNFGPNTTSFIIPGEIFPTRYRATAYGISAAAGKLGAIVAQLMFNSLVDPVNNPKKFLDHSFEILALFMLIGLFSTMLVPETMGKSLEVLSNEDQEGFMRPPARPVRVEGGLVIPMRPL
ncbi:phosphate permease [Mycena pura]|uniref:Phosphate permease n=1 Tax=Mycena pura TaxID=153505 RepID=A0AAD6V516_9AGAR|nr:phosphate permease [Mycena pura]